MIHSARYDVDSERTPFIVDIRRSICRQMCSLARKVRASVNQLSCKKKKDEIERLTSPQNHPFLQLKSDEGEQIIHHRTDVERVWKGVDGEHELRIRQYQMADNLRYFVGSHNKFANVCDDGYVPSKMDVLRTRLPTSSVVQHRISVDSGKLMTKTKRFVFFDVGGQKCHRNEWLSLLHDKKYVVFFASLAEYNEKLEEDDKTNRLNESIALFQQIVRLMQDKNKSFILMLNKEDLFNDKFIHGQIKLSDYFPDYIGSDDDGDEAKQFIKSLFLKGIEHEQIFTRFTTAIDESNIKSVFDDIMHHHFFTT